MGQFSFQEWGANSAYAARISFNSTESVFVYNKGPGTVYLAAKSTSDTSLVDVNHSYPLAPGESITFPEVCSAGGMALGANTLSEGYDATLMVAGVN